MFITPFLQKTTKNGLKSFKLENKDFPSFSTLILGMVFVKMDGVFLTFSMFS